MIKPLTELGLHLGSQVKVLHGKEGDSIMVAVGDARIGINYQMAKKILVH